MSTEDYSWVVLSFQLAYTVMQTVAGSVLDALGTRLGFFIFAVGWALANMAHALATGTWSLALFRGLLGATEAAAIPLYLVAVWQLDLKSIALWAWLPFLAADFGSLAAGLLPTWLMKPNLLSNKGVTLLNSRKITMTIGALCMIGPACIGLAGSPGLAIALFCVGGFAHQMLNGALLTLCTDVFDSKTVGTASGTAGSFAWIGGMLFTLAIGQSADSYGYDPLFVALAGLDLVGALVLWGMLRSSKSQA